MSLWCHQVSAQSNTVWEEMSFEEFQDSHPGSHLGYPNRIILAILNLYAALMPPIKFWLNLTYSLGDVVWRISRWLPLQPSWISEQNNFSSSVLNLYNAPMPPIKFWLNLTYGFGGDVVWTISGWPLWRPPWISERKDFSNSESLCHPDASRQVWLNPTYGLRGDVVWRISRWTPWQPSWTSEGNDFSNSEFHCPSDASHQILAQSDLWFGRRCRLKNFKMAILDSRMKGFKQIWISVSLWCLPSSFGSIRLMIFGRRCHFKNFKMDTMAATLDIGTERI